jgi:ElaB/YqjD/DUF883 family membrane-anchored ribosome-binding protein
MSANPSRQEGAEGIGIGLSIGVGLGLLLSQLLDWSLVQGVWIGAAVGLVLGAAFDLNRMRAR